MNAKCLLVNYLNYALVFYYYLIFIKNVICKTIYINFITTITYKSKAYMFFALYMRAQDNVGKLNGQFLFSERYILKDKSICLKLINQKFKYIVFYNYYFKGFFTKFYK